MTFDIVIPHFGAGRLTDLCRRCLETIREHSRDYRLILIDNASPEFDAIAPELERHPHTLIRNTRNLGFIKAVNQGLALSTAPYIVLMNNDTEAVVGWLEKLRAPLMVGASISGPRTTTPDSWQGRTHAGDRWEYLHRTAMLAFFCTMFKRRVFDKLGFLDEDFGAGFGDDDWFCHRAQQAGFRLAIVRNLVIPHHHRSTFKVVYGEQAIPEMQNKAMELLRAKQGQV